MMAKKKGFSSDAQRKAVMALLKDKRKAFTKNPSEEDLRAAGFYPQGKSRWATWWKEPGTSRGTNVYLHHLAWRYHNKGEAIPKGKQVHHKSREKMDNRKGNLEVQEPKRHAAITNIARSEKMNKGIMKVVPEKVKNAVIKRKLDKQDAAVEMIKQKTSKKKTSKKKTSKKKATKKKVKNTRNKR